MTSSCRICASSPTISANAWRSGSRTEGEQLLAGLPANPKGGHFGAALRRNVPYPHFWQSLHAGNLTDTPNEHALSDFQDELLPNDLVGRRRRGRKKGEIKTSPSGLCRYGMHSAAPVPLANGGSRKEANPRPPGQATSSTPPALILYQCWGKNEREDRTRRYALQKQIPRVVNTTA